MHEGGSANVFGGGSWRRLGADCAAADRDWGGWGYAYVNLGFRLLAVPSGE